MGKLNLGNCLRRTLATWAAAGLIGGCADMSAPPRRTLSAGTRPGGPDWANLSLNLMVEKYGPPDRLEINRVVWQNKRPWKRIVVWDDMEVRQMSMAMDDNIEETITYLVPADKRRAVERLDGRLRVSADGAELSARSFSEERNFLALNLADELIRGVKTPEEAKTFDAATLQLADAGKSSPYMQGLMFLPPPLPPTP